MVQFSVIGSVLYYVLTFGLCGFVCKTNIKSKIIKFILIMIPALFLASFRYNVGYDYGSYIEGYQNAFDISYATIWDNYKTGDPIAFDLLTKYATNFNSERVYLGMLAFLSLAPGVIYILREWDDAAVQPLIMFCFLFSPFIFSFSACKQGIALSFLMFSLTYIYKRKPIKFAICVLIASLFHSTALCFIPVYFFINREGKVSTARIITIIVACIIVIINLKYVLANFLEGRYEVYAIDSVDGRNRTFWLYLAMAVFFVMLSRYFIALDQRNELLIMLIVVGAMLQYLGFSNAFAKRIGEYFMMAQVFLLPQVPYIFTERSRVGYKLLLVIYIIAIFLIANPTAASGMGFVPYTFSYN